MNYQDHFLSHLLYFPDYKMHFPPEIWEKNGGESYSPNVAYLARGGGWVVVVYVIKYFSTFVASKIFFLLSSSKTQLRFMV